MWEYSFKIFSDEATFLSIGPTLSLRFGFQDWGSPSDETDDGSTFLISHLFLSRHKSNGHVQIDLRLSFIIVLVMCATAPALFLSGRVSRALARLFPYFRPRIQERLWNSTEYAQSLRLNRQTSYEYRQLDASKAEIRLLQVLCGSHDDAIHVNIIHASLQDKPDYVALSYAWGSSTSKHSISMNGYDFSICSNLKDALSHIRQGRGASRISLCWIDALCINQSDTSEVSEQVRLMTQIYEQATTIVVWLGVPSAEMELAFAMMRTMVAYFDTRRFRPNRPVDDMKPFEQEISYFSSEANREGWDAITRLFSNPYFKRAWVAQEITNPIKRNVEFIGGRKMQRFSLQSTVACAHAFARVCTPAQYPTPSFIESARAAFRVLNKFETFRDTRYRLIGGPMHWMRRMLRFLRLPGVTMSRAFLWRHEVLPLLNDFREFEATDPRDKVFSVFSIFKSHVPDSFINYGLSTKEVYKKVVRDAINLTTELDVLAYCNGKSRDSPSLPSWVPDWRYTGAARPICGTFNIGRRQLYTNSISRSPRVSFDEDAMIITGIVVDSITVLSELIGPYHQGCRSDWETTALQLRRSEKELVDIYRRTLMGDCIRSLSWNPLGRGWKDTLIKRWYTLISVFSAILNDNQEFNLIENSLIPANYGLSMRSFVNVFERISKEDAPYETFDAFHETLSAFPEYSMDGLMGWAADITLGRKLCTTEMQTLALVPNYSRTGDVIAIFPGACTPFVLRRVERCTRLGGVSEPVYELIGECYVHGQMDGKALESSNGEVPKLQSIVII